MATKAPVRALVLSGGGARGAYEVGVLEYIFGPLRESLGRDLRFNIITGTSVGAINASWIAGACDKGDHSITDLRNVWGNLKMSSAFKMSYSELGRVGKALIGSVAPEQLGYRRDTGGRFGGLLNTAAVDNVIRRRLPWDRITPNIQAGLLDALCITATEIRTGRSTFFIETRDGEVPSWTGDPRKQAIAAEIGPYHALASAAIPFLFPAVKVGNRYYCDGSLRQNTPLTSALRLGAERALIIGLKRSVEYAVEPEGAEDESPEYPGLLQLGGRLLAGFLLDPLEYDLTLLKQFNALAVASEDVGEEFAEKLNGIMREIRGAGLRNIPTVLVRPSVDIGRLAADHMREKPPSKTFGSGPIARAVRRFYDPHEEVADLLSFILYDGDFARELIELGYHDAQSQHDELVHFFE